MEESSKLKVGHIVLLVETRVVFFILPSLTQAYT